MNIKERIIISLSVLTCFLIQSQGADKYTDGNRPYEFGFTIDGEQHRHEKKDENGLIQGEFGFITADGVYHVTVYATDEQGRFKILSMKNIRVKPYPTYTAKQSDTSARQGHSLEQPALRPSVSSPVSTTTTTFKPISIEPPANSCSHCSLGPKPTPAPVFNQPTPNQIGASGNPKFSQGIKPQSNLFNQQNNANTQPQGSAQAFAPSNPTQPQNNLAQSPLTQNLVPPHSPQSNSQPGFGYNQSPTPGFSGTPTFPQQPLQMPANSPALSQNYPTNSLNIGQENIPGGRTPKRLDNESPAVSPNNLQSGLLNNPGAPVSTKPTLISAQMQIVDKNTDIYHRGPGEQEGLPEGLSKDDMTKLLYTFNYTVGFHGHFEEGYINGAKQGYYFVTGRNGVRTRVDYVADSKGFRPKITQEVLDLLSDDVPKPETEKEEKYGLKGYEFKWLYYPIESKGR